MNSIKRYNIVVTQRTAEEYVFSYEIIPSPITELWEKVVLSSIENNLKIKHFSHIKCNTPQETLDQITNICDSLPFEVTTLDIPEKIKDLTEPFLNELHQTFHRCFAKDIWGWKWELITEDHKASILQLNNLIHEIDNFERSRNFNIIKVNFDHDIPYQQSFSTDLYPYWDYTWGKIGDLRLGYSTLGKRLHECFKSNDLDVVKEKMVRPQVHILSEVYLIFSEFNIYKDDWGNEIDQRTYKKDVEFPQFLKWCKDNNVSEYGYDPLEPQHKYIGRPLLGKLGEEINLDFVKDIVCGYKNIRIEIE
jgi:hypothetical protein